MIETLCIVAEITAALLLLSLARPRNKSNDDRDLNEWLSETQVALEQGEKAIQTLQFLSILTASRSPDPQTLEGEEESSPSLNQQLGEIFSSILPLLPSMTADSLTLLPERKAIESLVEIAGEWQAWLDHPIQIAIVQPDGMGDMDHLHGPVACEKMIRATAGFLKGEIGGRGLISRFGFQAFAIALVGYSRDHAIKLIEQIRTKATESTWHIDELEIHSTFSASLVEVTTFEHAEVWEPPEDGLATAISQGGNRGYWRDFSDESWRIWRRIVVD
jgi:GGDEF domain-containing protein